MKAMEISVDEKAGPVHRLRSDFALGTLLAAFAAGAQVALNSLLARDSYQLFLAAVAISAIRGGAGNGAAALGISALAKSCLFFVPTYPGHGQLGPFLAWMLTFILVGSALCSVGGAVYVGLKRQDRELSTARLLRGLLPICTCCKRIMDEQGCWCDLESFITRRSDAEFSHAFCPRCAAATVPEKEPVS